jgi:hypothetical protein
MFIVKKSYTLNIFLKKLIEEDITRCKNLPCSWINRINIVKKAILAKVSYWFDVIPNKISMSFLTEIEKFNSKFEFYDLLKDLK